MARKKVKVADIENAVSQILEEYGDGVAQDLADVIKETANEIRDEIESNVRSEFGGTGEYAASWDVLSTPSKVRQRVGFLVYSRAPHYRLTHLLENSHLMRNGQRWTWNKPIIANAEKSADRKIISKIRAKLGG